MRNQYKIQDLLDSKANYGHIKYEDQGPRFIITCTYDQPMNMGGYGKKRYQLWDKKKTNATRVLENSLHIEVLVKYIDKLDKDKIAYNLEVVTWALFNSTMGGTAHGAPIALGEFPRHTRRTVVQDILRDDMELEGEARVYTTVDVIDVKELEEIYEHDIQKATDKLVALQQLAHKQVERRALLPQ